MGTRLDEAARTRVEQAMVSALSALRGEVVSTPVAVARELGVPTGREAGALVEAFKAALFERRAPAT